MALHLLLQFCKTKHQLEFLDSILFHGGMDGWPNHTSAIVAYLMQ
jgi:hypothetical protein